MTPAGVTPAGPSTPDGLVEAPATVLVMLRPHPHRRRAPGWVPQQHGAWAMLVVPFVAGCILRWSDTGVLPGHLAPLFVFWILGYFAFNAASLWLKAAPVKRPALLRPLLTYAGAAALAGLATLAMAGGRILWWALLYLPLLVPALMLAAQRRERATLGGALTVAAASVMALVARFTTPLPLLAVGEDPGVTYAVVVAACTFAYFFGTVLHVKANIRERDNPRFYAASVAWHAAATLAAAAASAVWGIPVGWALFFLATLARAVIVSRLPGRISPPALGLIEVGFSVLLVAIVA